MQHLIQKQILDIRLLESNEPRKQQEAIQSLYWNQLLPALNQALDDLIPANQMLKMESLEIDLGLVAHKDLSKKFVEAVAKAIKGEWKKAQESGADTRHIASITSSENAALKALFFFLTHGIFPWWYTAQKRETPKTLWNKNLKHSPKAMLQFLQTARIPKPILQKRLQLQFETSALEDLFVENFQEEKVNLEILKTFFTQFSQIDSSAIAKNTMIKKVTQQLKGPKGVALLNETIIQFLTEKSVSNNSKLASAVLEKIALKINISSSILIAELSVFLKQKNIPVKDSIINLIQKFDQTIQKRDKVKNEFSPTISTDKRTNKETTNSQIGRPSVADKSATNPNTSPDINADNQSGPAEKDTVTPDSIKEAKLISKSATNKNANNKSNKTIDKSTVNSEKEQNVFSEGKKSTETNNPENGNASVNTEQASPTTNSVQNNALGLEKKQFINEEVNQDQSQIQDKSSLNKNNVKEAEWLATNTKAIQDELAQGIYIEQAGLVLVAPFLPTYFSKIGLVKNNEFIDEACAARAALLLYYLATGETTVGEQHVLLPKILTGMSLTDSLPNTLELNEKEIKETEALLSSVIEHWAALGSSGIDALRETFLCREGKIVDQNEKLKLIVSRKTVDILLDKISWSYTMIKLPWMDRKLTVVW